MIATRTYLELTNRDQLSAVTAPTEPGLRVDRVERCPPSFYRYLYCEVGRAHHWVDRLEWTDEMIRAHLSSSALSVCVLYTAGAPAGYFELRAWEDGSVEIAYFGLVPAFIGRGLGKYLLGVAVERAWDIGANRVWLHTSSLDHASALPNYRARGFRQFRQERYQA